jgi:hypothetical protein
MEGKAQQARSLYCPVLTISAYGYLVLGTACTTRFLCVGDFLAVCSHEWKDADAANTAFGPWLLIFAGTQGMRTRVFHALHNVLRAIQRLHSANSVVIWAVFFIKPRYRVFV